MKILNFLSDYWFLISGVLIPIGTFFIGKYKSKNLKLTHDITLLKKGMCAMQREILLKNCETYLTRGWCTFEEKESLNALYEAYHNLGGDSFITDMVKQVNKLPIRKKESNNERSFN